MELKMKDIFLHHLIIVGRAAVAIFARLGVDFARLGIGGKTVKHLYVIPPRLNVFTTSVDVNNPEPKLNYLVNRNAVRGWSVHNVIDIQKDLQHLNLLDIMNWLKYLNKADFEKHNDYVLALLNINTLLHAKFKNYTYQLNPCSKHKILSNLIHFQSAKISSIGKNKNDIKEFNKYNQIITDLLKSKNKYFLDDKEVSNKDLHKHTQDIINILREQVLNVEIKSSKHELCPFCHHMTFSHFDFCQHCGRKLN